MDQLFASFLLLGEGPIFLTSLLLIILGGMLGSRVFQVEIELRRVSYLWFITLSGLALTVTQTSWLFISEAADAGLFSALVIFAMGSFVLFGMAIYYGSAARMRDISGKTEGAWMGFVPFVNLWLIFKGKNPELRAMTPRHATARYILDPLLIFGALVVLSLTQFADREMKTKMSDAVEPSPKLRELFVTSQTLEESLANDARLAAASLPFRIDDITRLTAASAQGTVLTLTYEVDREFTSFIPTFKSMLAEAQCAPDVYGPDIRRGGTIRMIYRTRSGRIIDSYDITAADCPS